MIYLSVAEIAKKWGKSDRSVRNYCAEGRIPGAYQEKGTWYIPDDAILPQRRPRTPGYVIDTILRQEKAARLSGGLYHRVQIDLTYNSNHMEGSCLSHEQTRHIFETSTLGIADAAVRVDDIIETVNHFRCIDYVIDSIHKPLTEAYIKQLHRLLKSNTGDADQDWFAVGDYKRLPNEVGGHPTVAPEEVPAAMQALLSSYGESGRKALSDLLAFHVSFEKIHPFQDGNGRVGRLILFKECLKYRIVPFIIEDDLKLFYYRGLAEWDREPGYLTDTCLAAQDRFKRYLDYFRIAYKD